MDNHGEANGPEDVIRCQPGATPAAILHLNTPLSMPDLQPWAVIWKGENQEVRQAHATARCAGGAATAAAQRQPGCSLQTGKLADLNKRMCK